MAVTTGSGSVPSLPPPRPKSPPEYPDLCGKRRELAKVKMLEWEIGFLEEELKSVEDLPPASRSCKEVADFVIANADPLIPIRKKIPRSQRFWKWICGISCFDLSWICCCCSCWPKNCCACDICSSSCSNPCANCRMPKCRCSPCDIACCSSSCWNNRQCFSKSKCSWNCCCCRIPKCPTCFTCPTMKCTCYPIRCPKLNICSCCCTKNCCFPCYYC